MFEITAAALLAFAITAIVGPPLIRLLQRLKFGQKILEIGPKWHLSKQNTPTMGGFMFMVGVAVSVAATGTVWMMQGDYRHLTVLGFCLIYAAIGFFDDFEKVKNKRNKGLTPLQKLALQTAAAILFLTVLRVQGYLTPNLYVPFINTVIPLGWYVFMPFAAFVIVGTVNAVNLTDGVDGLAAGVTLPVAGFFTVIYFIWKMSSLAAFSAALFGALLAFLMFNFYPAKVFMGDTGSLFLGGAVCGMAFACDMPLILIPVGIIYIAEALSDIIQVLYFKVTRGRRLFRMAPLHHHFEMIGWSEKKIVYVFSMIAVLFCFLAYFGILGRYPT